MQSLMAIDFETGTWCDSWNGSLWGLWWTQYLRIPSNSSYSVIL